MNNKFPKLNLEKFAQNYQSFFDTTITILEKAETRDTLKYILPGTIYNQYRFSEHGRNHYGLMSFLRMTYLPDNDKENFLSLLNSIVEKIVELKKNERAQLYNTNKYLWLTINDFIDLLTHTNDAQVFNLEFYYDKEDEILKRKLDNMTVEIINQNTSNFDTNDANKLRYEECVAEFLAFRHNSQSSKHLLYNQSLDKLKRIIENTLERLYTKKDASPPKLSNRKQISNILFDGPHPDFENLIGYIISNIHHEQGGQPKNFTEKEYVYLWLELNQILYLLNRYKK